MSNNKRAPSVLLVEAHTILRDGLRLLLQQEDCVQVVAEAGDGRTAVRSAQNLQPDLVILDLVLPELNGIEATRQIHIAAPETKIIGISTQSDRRSAREVLQAGASGFLVTDSDFPELCLAIREVLAGHTFICPLTAALLDDDNLERLPENDGSVYSLLTPREREVLQLVAEGHSTRGIAGRLHVSVKTVESHRQRLMSKLEIRSVAGLTKYAIRQGLTTLEL